MQVSVSIRHDCPCCTRIAVKINLALERLLRYKGQQQDWIKSVVAAHQKKTDLAFSLTKSKTVGLQADVIVGYIRCVCWDD